MQAYQPRLNPTVTTRPRLKGLRLAQVVSDLDARPLAIAFEDEAGKAVDASSAISCRFFQCDAGLLREGCGKALRIEAEFGGDGTQRRQIGNSAAFDIMRDPQLPSAPWDLALAGPA